MASMSLPGTSREWRDNCRRTQCSILESRALTSVLSGSFKLFKAQSCWNSVFLFNWQSIKARLESDHSWHAVSHFNIWAISACPSHHQVISTLASLSMNCLVDLASTTTAGMLFTFDDISLPSLSVSSYLSPLCLELFQVLNCKILCSCYSSWRKLASTRFALRATQWML
jgi:hypothetical protein